MLGDSDQKERLLRQLLHQGGFTMTTHQCHTCGGAKAFSETVRDHGVSRLAISWDMQSFISNSWIAKFLLHSGRIGHFLGRKRWSGESCSRQGLPEVFEVVVELFPTTSHPVTQPPCFLGSKIQLLHRVLNQARPETGNPFNSLVHLMVFSRAKR